MGIDTVGFVIRVGETLEYYKSYPCDYLILMFFKKSKGLINKALNDYFRHVF